MSIYGLIITIPKKPLFCGLTSLTSCINVILDPSPVIYFNGCFRVRLSSNSMVWVRCVCFSSLRNFPTSILSQPSIKTLQTQTRHFSSPGFSGRFWHRDVPRGTEEPKTGHRDLARIRPSRNGNFCFNSPKGLTRNGVNFCWSSQQFYFENIPLKHPKC